MYHLDLDVMLDSKADWNLVSMALCALSFSCIPSPAHPSLALPACFLLSFLLFLFHYGPLSILGPLLYHELALLSSLSSLGGTQSQAKPHDVVNSLQRIQITASSHWSCRAGHRYGSQALFGAMFSRFSILKGFNG